jgi:hypothetical protein
MKGRVYPAYLRSTQHSFQKERWHMAYPGAKVHRTSRRKLGRGQYPPSLGTTVTLTNPSANVVDLTFARPVVVTGIIPTQTSAGVLVNQQVSSGTLVIQTYNVSQAAATIVFPPNAANVTTQQGGGVAGTSITF